MYEKVVIDRQYTGEKMRDHGPRQITLGVRSHDTLRGLFANSETGQLFFKNGFQGWSEVTSAYTWDRDTDEVFIRADLPK